MIEWSHIVIVVIMVIVHVRTYKYVPIERQHDPLAYSMLLLTLKGIPWELSNQYVLRIDPARVSCSAVLHHCA